ncbi:MAG: hypothetical protein OXF07_08350 [Rhodobacter sp.]|nr:hypothetical protein [Rhodobacter sp.]
MRPALRARAAAAVARAMAERPTETERAGPDSRGIRVETPIWLFAGLVLSALTLTGVCARNWVHGDFSVIHALLVLFLSVNLMVCYLEICLALCRDYVDQRIGYWRDFELETGRSSIVAFLASRVPLSRLLLPITWADLWAIYSQMDRSYADRRSYGYNIDFANGFLVPVPTLILYLAYSVDILPAPVTGIIGVMLYWQLVHGTLVYWIGFFGANLQGGTNRRYLYFVVLGLNSQWVFFGLLGIHVSIQMILNGDYSVFGH